MTSALAELSEALANVELTVPAAPARFLRLEFLEDAPEEAAAADVWSVTLDVSGLDAVPAAGDTVGLLCPNAADEVAAALDLLGAESRADRPCRLSLLPGTTKKAARVPPHLPEHASLRHLLTHCVDLRAVPKKPLLQALRDDAPLVMVAAGTGLAPLAGFLEERRARGQRAPAWLVFGCRHPELDFLLRDELEAALRDGFLSRLDTVFSRTGDRQRYVQHVLAEEQARLARWLVDEGAVMYVCGDAKGMAVAVLDEVVQTVAKAKEVPVSEAKKLVQQMQKDGQYRLDVWS
ncbi:methionine synthase reductase-like [Pollicipes pollicipes]|uniref:methionine synthase reductase-like n=1 Tax=Pollicipes pollicipes TaxID=41117 RepID=UPI001885963E|nr:methionine synthase reductase-like [Pollicipes pollicipes]